METALHQQKVLCTRNYCLLENDMFFYRTINKSVVIIEKIKRKDKKYREEGRWTICITWMKHDATHTTLLKRHGPIP